jgi:3-deoxy-D-manno-octulosonic-acid transferase
VRKSYEQADYIYYLPLDTPWNVMKFLDIVQPEMSFFIKYDFWFNYLDGLHGRSIPVYVISAIFREDQYFFKWYGRWACLHLRNVSHFFVQNIESENLLNSVGVQQVTVTGDTRFDRVAAIASQNSPIPLIEKFCAGKQVFIAGSSWAPDEEVFIPLVQKDGRGLKYIIAPHDTSARRIKHIRERIDRHVILFSELNDDNAGSADILIIDSVGLLSKLYRYATIAYIGGGFGAGIHNIQEPVTFGIPVFFGPNYQKFREARDLVKIGGAIMIASAGELLKKVIEITGNPKERSRRSGICSKYVAENTGATEKVMKYLEKVSG